MTYSTQSYTGKIKDNAWAIWHLQRVKRLVRSHLGLGPTTLITVVEIECKDPQCPGPETHISVLGADMIRRAFVIRMPAKSVLAEHLKDIQL